jgi:pilus assembly protein Flp/PilA
VGRKAVFAYADKFEGGLFMEERLTLWAVRLVERARGIREDEGQALVEYALILALIAVVSIGVLTVLGQNVSTILDSIGTAIGNAT